MEIQLTWTQFEMLRRQMETVQGAKSGAGFDEGEAANSSDKVEWDADSVTFTIAD